MPAGPGAALPGDAGTGRAAVPEVEPAEPGAARTEFELDAWIAAVERDGPADAAALRKRLEEAELRLRPGAPVERQLPALCPGTATTFGGVRRTEGQFDDDAGLETAVRIVVEVAPQEGTLERCEEIWLGLFDPGVQGAELVLVAHRRLYHCMLDDRDAAVTAGFTATEPSADAAFWMERQQIDACGTLVDYRYQRFVVRSVRDELTVERSNTESTTYDRPGGP